MKSPAGLFTAINRAFASSPDFIDPPAVLPMTFSAKITNKDLCGQEGSQRFCL
jgi:hypothetical protein